MQALLNCSCDQQYHPLEGSCWYPPLTPGPPVRGLLLITQGMHRNDWCYWNILMTSLSTLALVVKDCVSTFLKSFWGCCNHQKPCRVCCISLSTAYPTIDELMNAPINESRNESTDLYDSGVSVAAACQVLQHSLDWVLTQWAHISREQASLKGPVSKLGLALGGLVWCCSPAQHWTAHSE